MKKSPDPTRGFSPEIFAARRKRVLADLDGSALVLSSETDPSGGRHRPDRDLFYLTGVTEPGAVAVLRADGEDGDFVLFVRVRNAEEERWIKIRLSTRALRTLRHMSLGDFARKNNVDLSKL